MAEGSASGKRMDWNQLTRIGESLSMLRGDGTGAREPAGRDLGSVAPTVRKRARCGKIADWRSP